MVEEIFDEIISRENTDCSKYDDRLKRFGRSDVLPMWVADMDFRAPDCVRQALQQLVDHNLYGYHLKTEKYSRAIVDWWARRHRYTIDPASIVFSPGAAPRTRGRVLRTMAVVAMSPLTPPGMTE